MQHTGDRGEPSADYTGSVPVDAMATTLSGLARSLHEESTVEAVLDAIAAAAVGTVPGARYAGLTVVQNRRFVETRAATDDLVRQTDQAQYETGEGPCLDSVYEQHTVRLTDMTTERRWPAFARRATALGMRSMLSLQLYVEHDNLGALNLYATEPDAFDDESEAVGLLFAAHAAVALSGARQREHFGRAVTMRDLIGQAKGILMERHKLTADQAFLLLVRASQETNTKLAEVARHLAETGELSAASRRAGPRRDQPSV